LKDFVELPLKLGNKRKILAKIVRVGAQILEKRIESLAPDDPSTPGSQISENIDVNLTDQTADGVVAYIGPNKKGFIAGFAELGTAHQVETPFISTGYEQVAEDALGSIKKELGDFIQGELTK